MEKFKIFLKLSLLLVIFAEHIKGANSVDDVIWKRYYVWKDKFHKNEPESDFPFENFKKNFLDISRHNLRYYAKKANFFLSWNGRSADPPPKKKKWNGFQLTKKKATATSYNTVQGFQEFPPAPSSLDYRTQGLVTPVADQGYFCGSCYAFSATCALEGQVAKMLNRLVPLSNQNINDCSFNYGNEGCEGGNMENAYNYIKFNPGMANESSYPYEGVDQECRYDTLMKNVTILDYSFIAGDEENLKRALAFIGPLAVAIKGDLESFYYYGGGMFDDPNCNANLNHAACLVGYGTDNTTNPPSDYWIIKNSWSTDWGENGYIRMKRGSNLCGISNYVIHPIVAE